MIVMVVMVMGVIFRQPGVFGWQEQRINDGVGIGHHNLGQGVPISQHGIDLTQNLVGCQV